MTMMLQQSRLQALLAELSLVPAYHMNGRNFYDTREIFDRHNFARDVRRNVKENDWIFIKPRYLLSEHGIVQFAFRKNVPRIIEKLLTVLDTVSAAPAVSAPLTMPAYPRLDAPAIPPITRLEMPPEELYSHPSEPVYDGNEMDEDESSEVVEHGWEAMPFENAYLDESLRQDDDGFGSDAIDTLKRRPSFSEFGSPGDEPPSKRARFELPPQPLFDYYDRPHALLFQ